MLTLAIIKPDAVQGRNAGKILAQLEATGFVVRAARLVKLTTTQAEAFYEVHRARRSEEHTSELQSPCNLVCRLLLEKKKKDNTNDMERYSPISLQCHPCLCIS